MSEQSDLASTSSNPTTSGRNPSEQNNVDIRALAQEVAAVLYQNPTVPPKNYSPQDLRRQMSVQNHDEPDYASTSHHPPPPNYRAATGPGSTGESGKGRNT